MTQEDELEISHQQSNSVCNQVNDDKNDNNSTTIKSNSKNNIIKTKITSIGTAAAATTATTATAAASIVTSTETKTSTNFVTVAIGDIDIQNQNKNFLNDFDESIVSSVCNGYSDIKNSMGAANVISSKENQITTEHDSTSSTTVSVPSPSPSLSPSSVTTDQLPLEPLTSSSTVAIIVVQVNDDNDDDNKNRLNADNANNVNENSIIRDDINSVAVDTEHENKSAVDQNSIVTQTIINADFINCDTITTENTNNDLIMTVIKSQNNSDNIREILQMKIDSNENKNNTNNNETNSNNNSNSVTDNSNNDSQPTATSDKVISNENENKLNEVQINENNDHDNKKSNENSENKFESENQIKKIEEKDQLKENKSNVENVLNNKGIKLKRRSKERSLSQDRDDPIARLNALKANISNALKEVKAVLSEHGGESNISIPENPKEEEKEEIANNSISEKSNQEKEKVEISNNMENSTLPNDDGVIKFRFVKKVRRRSTFDDDKNAVTEIIVNQIIDNQNKENENNNNNTSELSEKTEKTGELNVELNSEKSEENVNSDRVSENQVKTDSNVKNEINEPKEGDKSELKVDDINKVEKDKNILENQKHDETSDHVKTIVKKVSPKVKKIVKNDENSNKTDDKKSVKTKKLVKRNSKDDSALNIATSSNVGSSGDNNANVDKKEITVDVPSAENDSKRKVVKKVSSVKKSIKSNVASALDKVLATTNFKLSDERRASIATTKVSGPDTNSTKSTLEKRRLSTSAVKDNQITTNSKQNSNTEVPQTQKIVKTSTSTVPKNSTSLSLENNTETKLENSKSNQKLTNSNQTKEKGESISTSTLQNGLPSIQESEKENIAPTDTMKENKNRTIEPVNNAQVTQITASKPIESKEKQKFVNEVPANKGITKQAESSIQSSQSSKSVTKQIETSTNIVSKPIKTSQESTKPESSNQTKETPTQIETSVSSSSITKPQSEPEKSTESVNLKNEQNEEHLKKPTAKQIETSTKAVSKQLKVPQDSMKSEISNQTKETLKKIDQSSLSLSSITKPTNEPQENKTSRDLNQTKQTETPTSNVSNIKQENTKVLNFNANQINKELTVEAVKSQTNLPSGIECANKIQPSKMIPVEDKKETIVNKISTSANNKNTDISISQSQDTVQAVSSTESKENSQIISNETQENENQTQMDSNSVVVRNEITAKLAELKRPPFRMPIVNKTNLEASKIHPLMVLHITPPKNASVTTLKKTPQKATIKSSTVDNDGKKTNENEETDESEEVVGDKKVSTQKRKSKKVVIRKVKRRLSLDAEEKQSETEIEEKDIEPKTPEPENHEEQHEEIPGKKTCLKARIYEPGETVMYALRIKNSFKWKKATVLEKITSISYKLDVGGEEKPAHISCIKKYTEKKVHFGGKEYLEIDYTREEEEDDDDEEEVKYNIWARV